MSRAARTRPWPSLALASFRSLLAEIRADRRVLWFSLALLAVDLVWILYFLVGKGAYELDLGSRLYYHKELLITTDGGVPEWFGYAKTLLVLMLLIRLARATRQPVYLALALVFLVIVLDDALEIHETFGLHLARRLDLRPMLGLRARDFGELITWALLGAVVVPLLLLGLRRSRPEHRGRGLAFLVPLGALLFCAMVVDQLYGNLKDVFQGAGVLVDAVEDGGELVAITASCALALAAWSSREAAARAR